MNHPIEDGIRLNELLRTAAPADVLEVMMRLKLLPEIRYGMLDSIQQEAQAVQSLERLLAEASTRLRKVAQERLDRITRDWTDKEIEKSCGYKP